MPDHLSRRISFMGEDASLTKRLMPRFKMHQESAQHLCGLLAIKLTQRTRRKHRTNRIATALCLLSCVLIGGGTGFLAVRIPELSGKIFPSLSDATAGTALVADDNTTTPSTPETTTSHEPEEVAAEQYEVGEALPSPFEPLQDADESRKELALLVDEPEPRTAIDFETVEAAIITEVDSEPLTVFSQADLARDVSISFMSAWNRTIDIAGQLHSSSVAAIQRLSEAARQISTEPVVSAPTEIPVVGLEQILESYATETPSAIAVAGAPRYTPEKLDQAVARARHAMFSLESEAWDLAASKGRRYLAREFYVRLCEMSEIAIFTHSIDPATPVNLRQVHDVFANVRANSERFRFLGVAANGWLQWPQRRSDGIVIAGSVLGIRTDGSGCEYDILIPGKRQAVMTLVTPVSPQEGKIQVGDNLLVMGIVIDNPSQQLENYRGSRSRIVWGFPVAGLENEDPLVAQLQF